MTDTPSAPASPPPAPSTPPTTPAEAVTQLAALKANPSWTKGLMDGLPEQKRQFFDLHEMISKGDGLDQAMSGVLPDIRSSEQIAAAAFTAMNREIGVRDDLTKEFLVGHKTTQAWYDETARLKADRFSNPEWVKSLESGDRETRRQWREMNHVLTGAIVDEKGNPE